MALGDESQSQRTPDEEDEGRPEAGLTVVSCPTGRSIVEPLMKPRAGFDPGADVPKEKPSFDQRQVEEGHPHHHLGEPGLVDEEEGPSHTEEVDEPEGVPDSLCHTK